MTATWTHDSRWLYDSQYAGGSACAHARGSLCEAAGTGSVDFHADVTYNGRGQVLTQTYPGPAGARLDLTLGYTGLGDLQTVQDTASGLAYWTGRQYDLYTFKVAT